MLYWRNKISETTHVVDFPGDGVFHRTFCGAIIPADQPAYEGANDDCTCGACKYNMEQQKCQSSSPALA